MFGAPEWRFEELLWPNKGYCKDASISKAWSKFRLPLLRSNTRYIFFSLFGKEPVLSPVNVNAWSMIYHAVLFFLINLSGQGATTNISLGHLLVHSQDGILFGVERYRPGIAGNIFSAKRSASPDPLIQKILPCRPRGLLGILKIFCSSLTSCHNKCQVGQSPVSMANFHADLHLPILFRLLEVQS